jgi:hypothetical protein
VSEVSAFLRRRAGPCYTKQPCSSTRTGATVTITAVTSILLGQGHLPDRSNLPLSYSHPLTRQHPGHPASTFRPQKSKGLPRRSQLTSLRYQRIILQTVTLKMLALLRSHARTVAALAPPPCSPSFLLQKCLLQSRHPLSESSAVGRVLDSFSITRPRRGPKTRPVHHSMLICKIPLNRRRWSNPR